jgi:hypothetical protein
MRKVARFSNSRRKLRPVSVEMVSLKYLRRENPYSPQRTPLDWDAPTASASHMETIRMERVRIGGFVLFGLAFGLVGCASNQARYVYQDCESGVIAIPKNTPKMMAAAEVLMEKHFPGMNYEVVRSVEVETGGSRSTYQSDTTNAQATSLRGGFLLSSRLGHDRDRKQAESTKLLEARIVYRKRNPTYHAGLAFAESPEYTPMVYSDAVSEELLESGKKTTQLAKAHPKASKDAAVMPAAGLIKPPSPPSLGGTRE